MSNDVKFLETPCIICQINEILCFMEYIKVVHQNRQLVLLGGFTYTFFMSYKLATKLLLKLL